MIHYALLFVLLPGIAFAQTGTVSILPPQTLDNASLHLAPGVLRAQPVGNHVCAGFPELDRNTVDGKTIVAFTITADGKVTDASIKTSSGNTNLDSESELCVEGWLFTPATRDGHAVPERTEVKFVWKDDSAPDAAAQNEADARRMVTVPVWAYGGQSCEQWHAVGSSKPERPAIFAFYVEPDGSVKNISMVQSSGHPDIDKDALECLGERHYQPAKQDGKPIEVRISDWLY
jgi:TonB family protein